MVFWSEESVSDLIDEINAYFDTPNPSKKASEVAFKSMVRFLGGPLPVGPLRQYFYRREVLVQLKVILHNTRPHIRGKLTEGYTAGRRYIPPRYFYRVRVLGNYGSYPNEDYSRQNQQYTIYNGQPYLITKNSTGGEERSGTTYTEVSHITRNEIKLACTLMCTEGFVTGSICIYFEGRTRDISADIVDDVPLELRTQFLIEYSLLLNRLDDDHELYRKTRESTDPKSFHFNDSPIDQKRTGNFFDTFSINDYLLLRIATYLVKGTMLWRPEPFREESLANIFFALEGCMLLLQRKLGLDYDKVDRLALPGVFESLFHQGAPLFELIDEAIGYGGSRAWIVHPQVYTDYSWLPHLQADDYYDYEQIVHLILIYVLTDEILPDFQRT